MKGQRVLSAWHHLVAVEVENSTKHDTPEKSLLLSTHTHFNQIQAKEIDDKRDRLIVIAEI
jgi:hypothetical protein